MKPTTILIAGDRPDDSVLLTDILTSAHYNVVTASDGEEVLAKAVAEHPQLIILNVRLPKMDGYQVCKRLKEDAEMKTTPVILLTSIYRDSMDKVRGFEAGADDYLTQPVGHKEFVARVAAALRVKALYDEQVQQQQELERLAGELTHTNAALTAANAELARLAVTDPLTGIYTREHFHERLENEFARARRFHHPLVILRADVDDFRGLNERLGHDAGDRILRGIASVIQEISRTMDIVARIGGDEFGLILPETEIAGAQVVAERLHDAISSSSFLSDLPTRVTITQGLAALDLDRPEMAEDMLRRAERALARAKSLGNGSIAIGDNS